ncbi:NRAMP family divalent metal transporter [Runella slithyformis]|uniref:Transmembrane transport protein n=1 Tax=Runella slithyformis (strain ATCC 29530 / DSM 19594 / LMG 11500 / NCIMB 11436 / LSU 4) TaxID=761193 RepID=A0A7U4E7C9_RUNSL|nr:NRAMP family divalent metal transporter [Runella slithyformis]AEI50523.1 putative transmembrane transport protein [Runella slithyformis DSM 19594]
MPSLKNNKSLPTERRTVTSHQPPDTGHRPSTTNTLLGAAFLMATSAVGPGFLTQTTVFTQKLAANFGFVILLSILLDLGAQLNIWRIIAVTEKRAQDIANDLFFGLGYLLSALIVIGGFAFNIGNVAGAGLGIEVMSGVNVKIGATISTLIGISLFLLPNAGKAMDHFAKWLGLLMLLLIAYVVFSANPPLTEALTRTILPQQFDPIATITLVGGTVGGYITFAGGHRLLDAGIKGKDALPLVNRSATTGILVTSFIRYFLFLATLGVVAAGLTLSNDNPPASVFQLAAGQTGYRLFGVLMWSAAITSVIGSAYTSVSFLRTFHPALEKHHRFLTVGFIVISTVVFLWIGKPVQILVFVGTLNGFILPIALAVMLVAARNKRLVGSYRHPVWLQIAGWLVVLLMSGMALNTLIH